MSIERAGQPTAWVRDQLLGPRITTCQRTRNDLQRALRHAHPNSSAKKKKKKPTPESLVAGASGAG